MIKGTCSKEDFGILFRNTLEQAIQVVERALGHSISRNVVIRLHGAGKGGAAMSLEDAIYQLYLAPDRFYRIIDVGVFRVTNDVTEVFVRASEHAPGPWESTWNRPIGMGPFKVIVFDLARNRIS
jgi:hypothetical protein